MKVMKIQRQGSGIESRFLIYGYKLIEVYTPSHTIVPYDYHGGRWVKSQKEKAKEDGVEILVIEEKREATNPIGSGQGGRVRFGDSMMPSTYYVYQKLL